MSVSAAQSPVLQSQLAPQQQRQTAAIFDASASVPAAQKNAAPSAPVPETDTVSLQGPPPAAQQQAAPTNRAPEVFAEIWKDGTKIGNVYTDGTAIMPTTNAGIAAGSYFTAPMPFARAQEISRMVGGEMRIVDLKALQVAQTRNQLRSAYGA